MDQLIKGTLDLLILETLAQGPSYGYHITQAVLASSENKIELKEGSLYPALHKLERQKLLKADWQKTTQGRRRKYYKITPAGTRALTEKQNQWNSFASAIQNVLGGKGNSCDA